MSSKPEHDRVQSLQQGVPNDASMRECAWVSTPSEGYVAQWACGRDSYVDVPNQSQSVARLPRYRSSKACPHKCMCADRKSPPFAHPCPTPLSRLPWCRRKDKSQTISCSIADHGSLPNSIMARLNPLFALFRTCQHTGPLTASTVRFHH